MSWTASTDNAGGSGLLDYRVFRNGTLLATVTSTTYTDSTVVASTAYSYRISARDVALNESAQSTAVSVTTPPGSSTDATPPGVPAGLTSTGATASSVSLAWTASVDNAGGSGLLDYRVYRNGVLLATATATTYTDNSVVAATTYSYRVSARDVAQNESAQSTAVPVTTPSSGSDTVPPGVPTGLTSTAASVSSISLTWAAAVDNTGGSGLRDYRIYRNGNATPVATVTSRTYTDTGLAAATTYQYRVSARDNALNESGQSTVLNVPTASVPPADTIAPGVPAGLTATANSPTSVALSWTASTDNPGGSGLREYSVYRNGTVIVNVTSATYADNNVVAATTYSYRVSARDNALNESAQSTAASVTTPAPVSGLDARPSNTTCVAPARPTGNAVVALQQITGFSSSSPVSAMQAPGDSTRWFVVERAGRIRIFNVASATMSTFVDLTDRVIDAGDEEAGLLGLAFHPGFSSNGRFFVFYSGAPDSGYRIQSRIAEFTSTDRTTVNKTTERVLIRANKGESNHNGGQIRFGPDGYLYASLGDGGAGDDPRGNGQNRNNLYGKILRIDVNSGSPYGIPTGNPYAGNALCSLDHTHAFDLPTPPPPTSPTMCPEIYAYGLRNPWRFSFDRSSSTPDIWVGDVGQGAYEEINRIQTPGGNFGWDIKEGPGCHEPTSGCANVGADGNTLINPVAAAPRSSGLASIIGGFVYRGSSIPALSGRYLFTDFFSHALYLYDAAATNGYTTLLNSTGGSIFASSFAEDNAGELYLVDYVGGGLHRINPGGGSGAPPVPTNLTDTGCVNPGNPSQPSAGLIPYAPNAPFWSDGAAKERWMGLPNGTTITVNSDRDFDFPNGSVLVKNFRLSNLLVETRLFMKHPDGGWAGYSYRWNTAQTQATLVQGGTSAVWGGQTWLYPSETQCLQCHTAAAGFSLGLEIPQLNGPLTYPQTNRTANQITTLNSIGTLNPAQTASPSSLPSFPDPYGSGATLAERARAYLHTNCAQCHRPNAGTGVNMDLRYATLLSATATCDVAPARGSLGIANARIVAPGSADTSVLLARMNRRDANQMPPIASNMVDTQGVQLIRDWINGLGNCI